MTAVILAAGYATRMYPLTKNFPKSLLKIGNSTILDRLIDDLEYIEDITRCIIVTNHKFISIFQDWNLSQNRRFTIDVLDDGSTDNDNRLGAVRDIKFAVDNGNIDDDILVLAGDNLLDFSCIGFVSYFNIKKHSCIMYHYEAEISKLQRTGVVIFDEAGYVTDMQEKPQVPATHYAVPPFYIYSKGDLHLINDAIDSGCNVDAPGNLLSWMCDKCKIFAYEMPGKREDVGCLDDYNRIKDI